MTSKEQAVNIIINGNDINTNLISDGYHTFGELYDHRIILWIQYCKLHQEVKRLTPYSDTVLDVWRTTTHSDGYIRNGWFLLGIGENKGEQITYHLPDKWWDECSFAKTLDKAPEFDGHSSNDVLERILGKKIK